MLDNSAPEYSAVNSGWQIISVKPIRHWRHWLKHEGWQQQALLCMELADIAGCVLICCRYSSALGKLHRRAPLSWSGSQTRAQNVLFDFCTYRLGAMTPVWLIFCSLPIIIISVGEWMPNASPNRHPCCLCGYKKGIKQRQRHKKRVTSGDY